KTRRDARLGGGVSCVGVLVSVAAATAAACASHHTTTGLVLRVDRPSSVVTISHDAVPAYMEAMAMPFDLAGRARAGALGPADHVRVRLSVKANRSWLDRVEVISASPVDRGLQQTPAAPVLVPIGSAMPDFTLTDQSGAPLSLSGLKGKVVAVSFIYSRC